MTNDWHELTDLSADRRFLVTEVRMDSGISIQGEFELPPLARLRFEDQVFVSEFVRSHGSIKDMEKAYGKGSAGEMGEESPTLTDEELAKVEIKEDGDKASAKCPARKKDLPLIKKDGKWMADMSKDAPKADEHDKVLKMMTAMTKFGIKVTSP